MIGSRPNRASMFKSANLSGAGTLSEAQGLRGFAGGEPPKTATSPRVPRAGRLRLRRPGRCDDGPRLGTLTSGCASAPRHSTTCTPSCASSPAPVARCCP